MKRRWGLRPGAAFKHARELIDFDYLKELSEEELDWLDKFSREYHNNDFSSHDGLTPKGDDRKKYHARSNERRRDMWNYFSRMPHDYVDTTVFKDNGGGDADE